MTIQEKNSEFESKTPIQKFYAGENVLITGGTGFLGKLLIEKLLRSCPELSTIYLIIRSKKGLDIYQRLESIFDDPVFNRLKNEVPKFRHKVMVISGDSSAPGFGLSPSDKELIMSEISIIFNVAATVRFDEKIKSAIITNVNGPKEMINLCRHLKSLKAFIHVSTAFSNCIIYNIEEKIYEPPISGDNAIKLVNSLDDEKLDAITQTLLGKYPNTYTYTKCIAEQVIQQYGKDLPSGIFRPVIVTSSYQDPLPGWLGNLYGPTGVLAAVGSGLMKTLKVNKANTAEIVPADLTINALIASAWDVANNKNQDADPSVYNYCPWTNKMTWNDYLTISLKHGKKVPSNHSVWCYNLTITNSTILYYTLAFFLHLVPGFIVDTALFVTGKDPSNTKKLWAKLYPRDQEIFFFSMDNIDWNDYFKKCIEGIRVFVFKDEPNTIPQARKRMARILLINKLIIYTFVGLLIWILYSIVFYALFTDSRNKWTTVSESITIH